MNSAKMYLNRVRSLSICINSRIRQLEELSTMKTSIGSRTDEPVQTSKSGEAPYARVVEQIAELESETNSLVTSYGELKSKIISEIGSLDDPVHVELLMRRYVDYERFEKIAYKMSYSYDYIRRLHGQALKAFEDKYPEYCHKMTQANVVA